MIMGLGLAGIGQASVPRAFVSVNGSDANPCSAVQPCRSFNQALTVVEAGGEIVVQDSGGYSTGFTISQSVTIDAAGFNASVISASGTDLCTINAGATDKVVLRGISFHGANVGNGAIRAEQVGSLYVEHCSIAEFTGVGVWMLNGGNLFVTDTDVRGCEEGIDVQTSGSTPANLVAHDSRFTECIYGVILFNLGTGATTAWLSNCTASLCTFAGFSAEAGFANVVLTLADCRAVGNNFGIHATAANGVNATVHIANCVITQNTVGIFTAATFSTSVASVAGTSPGTNLIVGNGSGNTTSSSVTLQ
jgi:hypothetical protein